MSTRSEALAVRLEQGAAQLAELASQLTDEQWEMCVQDGRKIGVIVHHVASMYPVEIQVAQLLALGKPLAGVTWSDIHAINAKHKADFDRVTKAEALALLKENSAAAAAAIRAMSDEDLDRANTVSLNSDAPLTCQFLLEDHAVRHSYHHLASIRRALNLLLTKVAA